MSDMKMYNILGAFNNVDPKMTPVKEDVKAETVYESVEPRGSITEAVKGLEEKYMGFKAVEKAAKAGGAEDPAAVAASIGRKKYGKKKLQKAAAAGKKLGESARPQKEEFSKPIDYYQALAYYYAEVADNSGGRKREEADELSAKYQAKVDELYDLDESTVTEVFSDEERKAQRDATIERGYQAKREKNTKNYERAQKAAQKRAEERARKKVAEGEYDPAPIDPEAVAKRKRLQAIKDRQEEQGYGKDERNTPIRKVAGKAYGGAAQKDAPEVDDLAEKAPPGKKAERMVKHIKKAYSKDGKLTPKEKSIAYATAWKAHNKGQVEEGVEFGDTIKNSEAKMTKAKLKESIDLRNHPIYTTQEAWDHYAKELAEAEGQDEQYVVCVIDFSQSGEPIVRRTAPVEKAKADEILANAKAKDKFTNPLFKTIYPASEGKLSAEQVMSKFPDMSGAVEAQAAAQELDEIAKLAGLPTMDEAVPVPRKVIDPNKAPSAPAKFAQPATPAGQSVPSAPVRVGEEEMEEGNEFSGALAAAKASGAKDFEVDGKKYTVKEDVNVNISAQGEEDVTNLIRKLAGMPVVAVAAQEAEPVIDMTGAEEVAEERDVEHTNTPREETAGLDAAIPAGADLNRAKKQFKKEYPGDNPMAVEESLWKSYEAMINDIKG